MSVSTGSSPHTHPNEGLVMPSPGSLGQYLRSIKDTPLLDPESERTLFLSLQELRETIYQVACRDSSLRSALITTVAELSRRGTYHRRELQYGRSEGAIVKTRLAYNLRTILSIKEKLEATKEPLWQTRYEGKLATLLVELKLQEKLLLDLCRNRLKTAEFPELAGVLTRFYALRQTIAASNLRLVVSIAKRYPQKDLLHDIIQLGNIGLLKAVARFDPLRNVKFSTYATPWIKQTIQRELPELTDTVRQPSHWTYVERSIATAQDAIRTLGLPASDPITLHAWMKQHLPKNRRVPSIAMITTLLMPREKISLNESLDTPIAQSQQRQEELFGVELSSVRSLLYKLDPRTAQVLRLRFGLEGNEPHTLEQTGDVIGLTKERIRQLQDEGLKRVRFLIQQRQVKLQEP
jgi:RNA polymerase sigma factor (sigma-70 family)